MPRMRPGSRAPDPEASGAKRKGSNNAGLDSKMPSMFWLARSPICSRQGRPDQGPEEGKGVSVRWDDGVPNSDRPRWIGTERNGMSKADRLVVGGW